MNVAASRWWAGYACAHGQGQGPCHLHVVCNQEAAVLAPRHPDVRRVVPQYLAARGEARAQSCSPVAP